METFISTGSPARFENLRKKADQEPIRGQAQTIYYSYDSDQAILTGDAEIHTNESQFSGPQIIYDLTTGEISAAGKPSKRVIMMMQQKRK